MTDDIQKYWPQITAALIFSFALGSAHMRISALAEESVEHNERENLEKVERNEIRKKLTELEIRQGIIMRDIEETAKDVKELLRKLEDHNKESTDK